MARRSGKARAIEDDGLSSSDDDSSRDGNDAFASSSKRGKRTRRSMHDEANLGAFGDDDDDDDDARGSRRRGAASRSLLKGQAFVPASKASAGDEDDEGQQSESSASASDGDDALMKEAQQTRGEDELDNDAGDGFKPATFFSTRAAPRGRDEEDAYNDDDAAEASTSRPGVGGRGGIGAGSGAARGGIGSKGPPSFAPASTSSFTPATHTPSFTPSSFQAAGVPSSFGTAPAADVTPSDAFKKTSQGRPPKRSFLATPQTDIKFGSGMGGGFNPAAYLASMGWTGGGLGEKGDGMVKPIEVQLRPERAGIAFGGRKERTKQARDEARRRGEDVSESEDEKAERRRREKKADRAQASTSTADLRKAWTKERKPRKPKVEHRTYEEILEAAGGQIDSSGVGQIIDARSKELREVSSLATALAHHPVPTSDSARLPELRHNLRLIAESSKNTLDALAKEGAAILDKRRWLKREQEESSRRSVKARHEIEKLERVLGVVKEIEAMGKKGMADASVGLAGFDAAVAKVQGVDVHDDLGLDEAIVGAIAPVFKRIMVAWHPLEDAEAGQAVQLLTRWRDALGAGESAQDNALVSRSAGPRAAALSSNAEMSPFASLLWHLWMPKVRSAINNDWKPHHPTAAVALLASWRPLLPQYIWDNLVDQVLLPKLHRAVHEWEAKSAKASLHHIIFPWLPLLDESGRLDDTLDEARRRLRLAIKAWQVGVHDDELRRELTLWKEFFPTHHDFDSLVLTAVVPKLASHLKANLRINPSSQDLGPLANVMAWKPLLRSKMLARLLESDFLPKWLETLWTWLVQPAVDLGEVAQWYAWWKKWFAEEQSLPVGEGDGGRKAEVYAGLRQGFAQGIGLIHRALEMGEDERASQLAKPVFEPPRRRAKASGYGPTAPRPSAVRKADDGNDDDDASSAATFRRIIEERLSQADVLVLPLGKAHEKTGRPLLKASSASRSGGGVTFYLDDDVVWAQERGEEAAKQFVPVGVDELIARAKAR